MEQFEWKARLLKALANPRRLKIVKELYRSPKSFSELMQICGFRSSGELAFHLGMLRSLVYKREDGLYELTESGRKFVEFLEGVGNGIYEEGFVRVPPSSLDYILIVSSAFFFLLSIVIYVIFLPHEMGENILGSVIFTNGFVIFVFHIIYLFRLEIIQKYPYLINLPAFIYLLGNPLLSPKKRGEYVNKVFRIYLVSANVISVLTLFELNIIAGKLANNGGWAAMIIPLLPLAFFVGIIFYFRRIYRKVLEEL